MFQYISGVTRCTPAGRACLCLLSAIINYTLIKHPVWAMNSLVAYTSLKALQAQAY